MNTSTHTCRCGGTGKSTGTILLDLRSMQPPEPIQQALEAAEKLAPGEVLEVLTPLMPMPLLSVLAERGLQAQATSLPEGGAKVVIRHKPREVPAAS